MTQTDGYAAWDLLRERCQKVPADLWRVRREICIVFVGRAAADRACVFSTVGASTAFFPMTGSSTTSSTWSSAP